MEPTSEHTTAYTPDFRLADWTVRPSLNRLERAGETVPIPPRSMAVLVDLARHAGQVRSKKRLLHVVWGEVFVTDAVLAQTIFELRKVLGDDAKEPRYIETIAGRGYRLVASVDRLAQAHPDGARPGPRSRLGRYELQGLLGAGGMGEVYKAVDTRLGRPVAIKVLPDYLRSDRRLRKRFKREARTISRLQHPNVCAVFDLGSDDGADFLVMEYLEGETLERRLEKGPLPIPEVLEIGAQIAEGIAAAHKKGLVHRDLKPGNVMLTGTGAKVLDFGLARTTDDDPASRSHAAAETPPLTRAEQILGTPQYMSPEQLRAEEVGGRTDVFALGVILFEMTTGARPFSGDSTPDLISAVLRDEPKGVDELRRDTPVFLQKIIRHCLAKEPERRLRSREVAVQLSARQAPRRHGQTTIQRRWTVAATAFLLLALAGLGWLRFGRTAEVAAEPTAGEDASDTDELGFEKTHFAVMPFQTFTDDPELRQLAHGIPQQIISRTHWIVAPRSASFAQAGKGACDAARAVGVPLVLEGSVQGVADRIRASVQLIECPEGRKLWGHTYDRKKRDFIVIQDEISDRILAAMEPLLYKFISPELPYAILKSLTRESNERAMKMARGLIERQPDNHHWLFHAWSAHLQAIQEGWSEPSSRNLAEMLRLAETCDAVKPREWMCQEMLSSTYRFAGQREKAKAHADLIVEYSGGSIWTRGLQAALFAFMSYGDEAIAALDETYEIYSDPPFPKEGGAGIYAQAHFAAGHYREAVTQALVGTSVSKTGPINTRAGVYQLLAASYAHLGELEKAREALAKARESRPNLTLEVAVAPYASALPDHRERYSDGLRMAGLEGGGQ